LGKIRRIVIEHPFASGAVDATPVGTEEGGIEHPGAPIVAILEADPLVKV
jgi:hypothetical protein